MNLSKDAFLELTPEAQMKFLEQLLNPVEIANVQLDFPLSDAHKPLIQAAWKKITKFEVVELSEIPDRPEVRNETQLKDIQFIHDFSVNGSQPISFEVLRKVVMQAVRYAPVTELTMVAFRKTVADRWYKLLFDWIKVDLLMLITRHPISRLAAYTKIDIQFCLQEARKTELHHDDFANVIEHMGRWFKEMPSLERLTWHMHLPSTPLSTVEYWDDRMLQRLDNIMEPLGILGFLLDDTDLERKRIMDRPLTHLSLRGNIIRALSTSWPSFGEPDDFFTQDIIIIKKRSAKWRVLRFPPENEFSLDNGLAFERAVYDQLAKQEIIMRDMVITVPNIFSNLALLEFNWVTLGYFTKLGQEGCLAFALALPNIKRFDTALQTTSRNPANCFGSKMGSLFKIYPILFHDYDPDSINVFGLIT